MLLDLFGPELAYCHESAKKILIRKMIAALVASYIRQFSGCALFFC